MFRRILIAAALLLASTAHANDYALGKIRISHPWARATVPGAASGGGFMKLENGGEADRLVSASAGVSSVVELHTMVMDGNIMRMSKLEKGIELPAGKIVELKPGGLHIMFIELKAPLKQGDKFPLRLKFEKAGELTVDVQVEAVAAAAATPAMPHSPQH